MQGRAGLGFATNYRPIHRHAAAIFRQERAMHVQRAVGGDGQQWCLQHRAIVERKNKIGLDCSNAFHDVRRIRIEGCDDFDAMLLGSVADAVEPNRFVRVVLMGKHQAHIHAVLEQHRKAAHAYVVVGEHNGARHR